MSVALFDFDGTLVDSGPTVIGAAKLTLEKFGYPVPDDEAIKGFVGPPLLHGITQVLGVPEDKAEEFRDAYRAIYTEHMTEAELYPGVLDMIKQLTDGGWTLGIATSKREDLAEKIATAKGIEQYFTVIAGADMAEKNADKGAVIGRALELLKDKGIDGSAAIMVGDRLHDVKGATDQGLRSVFVTWGYGSEAEGRQAAAIAHNPTQCLGFLLELAA